MGAIATLAESALHVDPGEPTTTTLRVRNTGDVVDQFTFEVLGGATTWTSVEPTVLRLLPNAEEEVRVTFHPPRSAAAPAGQLPYAIKVVSQEDPQGSIVEEGTLQVAPFREVTAELIPRTTRGRRGAKQELAVDNRGNEPLNADVLAFDESEALDFSLDDPTIVAQPGHAMFTTVRLRPRKRFWRGPDRTIPYQLQLQTTAGEVPVVVDGSMVHQALIPKWLPKALLLLLLLLILLAVLWWTVLRPAIESAARESVEEDLAEVQQAAETAQATADEAAAAAGGGGGDDDPGDDEDDGDPGDPGTTVREVRTPEDFRLSVSQTPSGTTTAQSDPVTPGPDERLEITDIILQNPGGNVGTLEVRRGSDDVLLQVALENFRDLDYHFVGPLVFTEDAGVTLHIVCEETTDPSTSCSASALFSGVTVSTEESS